MTSENDPRDTATPDRAPDEPTRKTGSPAGAAGETNSPTRARSDATSPSRATVVSDTPVVAGPKLKKKELVDRVVALTGQKKNQAKPVVEATLDALGAALAEGEELDLPPFGKLKVTREKLRSNGRVLTCRLRQPAAAPPSDQASGLVKDPLAKPDEPS